VVEESVEARKKIVRGSKFLVVRGLVLTSPERLRATVVESRWIQCSTAPLSSYGYHGIKFVSCARLFLCSISFHVLYFELLLSRD
jgi:hypothetical protein